jgi:hypothetical protein
MLHVLYDDAPVALHRKKALAELAMRGEQPDPTLVLSRREPRAGQRGQRRGDLRQASAYIDRHGTGLAAEVIPAQDTNGRRPINTQLTTRALVSSGAAAHPGYPVTQGARGSAGYWRSKHHEPPLNGIDLLLTVISNTSPNNVSGSESTGFAKYQARTTGRGCGR